MSRGLQQIAMKQHVLVIESYIYSNGTVKAARAICPGNPDTSCAETNNRLMYRVIYCASKLISLEFSGRCKIIWCQQYSGKIRMNQLQ